MSHLLYLKKENGDPKAFVLYDYQEPHGGRLYRTTIMEELELASLVVYRPSAEPGAEPDAGAWVPVGFDTATGFSIDKFKANNKMTAFLVKGRERPASADMSSVLQVLQAHQQAIQDLQQDSAARRKRGYPTTTDTTYWQQLKTPKTESNCDDWFTEMQHAPPAQKPPDLQQPPEELGTIIQGPEVGTLLPKLMTWMGSLVKCARSGEVSLGNKPRSAVFFDKLQPPLVWVDTHDYPILDPYMPDISCFQQGHGMTAFSLITFIEIQRQSLDDSHRGKVARYTQCMMLANPARPGATGMLTSLMEMELYGKVSTKDQAIQCSLNATTGPAGKEAYWRALYQFVTGGPAVHGWMVPTLSVHHLQAAPLGMMGCLGVSRAVRVWDVKMMESYGLGTEAVCKHYLGGRRTTSYERERDCLLFLARHWPAEVLPVFPLLVACDDDNQLVISQPRVDHAESLTYRLMTQALAGLAVLHSLGFIYRDLEPKHWGVSRAVPQDTVAAMQRMRMRPKMTAAQRDRLQQMEAAPSASEVQATVTAVLQWSQDPAASMQHTGIFDCSTCTRLGKGNKGYAGTLLCASDDVLEAMEGNNTAGVPATKQQDLVAFVKTCYLMTHPYALDQYQLLGAKLHAPGQTRAEQVAKVRGLWAKLLNSATPAGHRWLKLIDMAHVELNRTASGPEYLKVVEQLHKGIAGLLCGHL